MDIIFKGETLSGEILESNSILQGKRPGGIRIFLKKERDKQSMGHWVECKPETVKQIKCDDNQ